jgi:hypothetical protein
MGTSGAAPMNALKQAFKDLNAAYKKSLESYCKTKHAEASTSICLPMLDRQLTGPLLQYKFSWNNVNKDPSACPCCGHSLTMPVESQTNVNVKNRKQRTKAFANGGDGKFNAVSAICGYYAYSHNCYSHVAGFSCNMCERKVADGVLHGNEVWRSMALITKFAPMTAGVVSRSTTGRRFALGLGGRRGGLRSRGI